MGVVQSLPSHHHHTKHGVDSNEYMSSPIDTYSITKPLRCASMCLADVSAAMSSGSGKNRRPHLLSRYTSRTLLLRPPSRDDESNGCCESGKHQEIHQLPSRPHLRMPSVEDIGIIAKSMDTEFNGDNAAAKSVSLPHSISLPHLPSHVERLQKDQVEELTEESSSSSMEPSQQEDKTSVGSVANSQAPKARPKGFSDLRQRLVRRLSLASRQSKKATKYLDYHPPAARAIDTGSQATIDCYHNLCADMDIPSLAMDDCVLLSYDNRDPEQSSLPSLTDDTNDAATFTTASSSLTLSDSLDSKEGEDQTKGGCKVHPAHLRGLLGALEGMDDHVSSSASNESLLVTEDYSHYDELLSADEGIGSDFVDGSIAFNGQTTETGNEEAVLCRWWPKCVLPVRNMQYMPKLAAMFAVAQNNAACKQCQEKYLEDCDNEQVMFGVDKLNDQLPSPPPQMMDLWYVLSRCPVRPTSSLALSSLKDMAKSCLSGHRLCKSHSAPGLSTKSKEISGGFYHIGNQPGGCSSGYRNRDEDSDSSDSEEEEEEDKTRNGLLGLPALNGNRNAHLHSRGHRQRQPKRVLSEPMQYILYNSYLRYYGRPQ